MAVSFSKQRPDSYMMDFHPMDYETGVNDDDSSTLRYMKRKTVYDPSRQLAFEGRVKQWLRGYILKNYSEGSVVMCIAPGHTAYEDTSFMYSLVKEFIDENKDDLSLEDGRYLLQRYKTIDKQSNAGSNRSEQTHRDSIRINKDNADFSEVYKGKIIIILDDVWTSGCTLRVCEEKVRTTGPRDVKLLAIGKTVSRMMGL